MIFKCHQTAVNIQPTLSLLSVDDGETLKLQIQELRTCTKGSKYTQGIYSFNCQYQVVHLKRTRVNPTIRGSHFLLVYGICVIHPEGSSVWAIILYINVLFV